MLALGHFVASSQVSVTAPAYRYDAKNGAILSRPECYSLCFSTLPILKHILMNSCFPLRSEAMETNFIPAGGFAYTSQLRAELAQRNRLYARNHPHAES